MSPWLGSGWLTAPGACASALLRPVLALTSAVSVSTCAQETQRLMAEPVPGITATPDERNARYFHVVIAGPQDSPFEGGTFKLELFLPEEYPMAAPKVRFMTKIYHPNVDKLGRICLDILKGRTHPPPKVCMHPPIHPAALTDPPFFQISGLQPCRSAQCCYQSRHY